MRPVTDNEHAAKANQDGRSGQHGQQHTRSRLSNPITIRSLLNEDNRPGADDRNSIEQLSQRQSSTQPRAQITQLPVATGSRIARREARSSPRTSSTPTRSPSQSKTSPTQDRQSYQRRNPPLTSRRPSASRAARPTYTLEQLCFIWYHRTDLGEGWDEVLAAYKLQFSQQREKGGLYCRFYRLLKDNNVEKVRAQRRSASDSPRDRVGQYGVVQRTNKRFRWMKDEHFCAPPLPQFSGQSPTPSTQPPCSGCSECGSP